MLCGMRAVKLERPVCARYIIIAEVASLLRRYPGNCMAQNSAFDEHKDELEHYEQMFGRDRGRLAVSLDRLTNALVLVGQHGVYCTSQRNPTVPAMDLRMVVQELTHAKELMQSVMEELRKSRGDIRTGLDASRRYCVMRAMRCSLRFCAGAEVLQFFEAGGAPLRQERQEAQVARLQDAVGYKKIFEEVAVLGD